jgi:hypothetical protein
VWFAGFVKRHHKVSLRQRELTSLARDPVFNEVVVYTVFDVWVNTVDENNTTYLKICNMNETSYGVVQRPQKIVTQTGKHQVGVISSCEREQNVVGVYAINASGFYVPPKPIYLSKRLKVHPQALFSIVKTVAGRILYFSANRSSTTCCSC